MADNIDGAPAAAQAGTGAAPDTTPTTPASDTAGRSAEDRIAGLVAERDRHKAAAEKAQADRDALAEKYKTEDEKRLDELVAQRVESEYGPAKQRLERIEAELTTKRDALLEATPGLEDCYDATAPIEVQVRQIERVASHLSTTNAAPTGVDSGGNPPAAAPKGTRKYSQAEYQQVQQWATTDPAKFDEAWPEMKAALTEGRVEGVSPGRIAMR